jgi:hypothetical protein
MKSDRGSAMLVVIVFLSLVTAYFAANASTLSRLKAYLDGIEQEHADRWEERAKSP